MTTASHVPPTGEISGRAREVISAKSVWKILRDSFLRFRHADGFSFARSMAFQVVLTLIPGVIFVVALAARIGEGRLRSLLREATTTLAPGPAGDILLQAFEQGTSAAGRGNMIALLIGGGAALVSGMTAMAQLQRGASRIYGVLGDRTTVRRYGLALALTLTAGALLTAAFLVIVLGSSVVGALQPEMERVWAWIRWPIGVATLTLALAALFKVAPNRSQPRFGWLALGGAIAVSTWLLVSIGLALYLNASTTFGQTYGPLAGFIGVMLWALLSSISIFYGLAIAAQTEAEQAGVTSPIADSSDAESELDESTGGGT